MSADAILGPLFFFFCAAACSFDLWKEVYFLSLVLKLILSFTFPNRLK